MRISTGINYSEDFKAAAEMAQAYEAAGVDMVWIAEAYGFDAVSILGFLAASTETIELGSGILNTYSRTPACLAPKELNDAGVIKLIMKYYLIIGNILNLCL